MAILFELCDVGHLANGTLISQETSSRNQSNGDIAEKDIDVISHRVIRPMLSFRISISCIINQLTTVNKNLIYIRHFNSLLSLSLSLALASKQPIGILFILILILFIGSLLASASDSYSEST